MAIPVEVFLYGDSKEFSIVRAVDSEVICVNRIYEICGFTAAAMEYDEVRFFGVYGQLVYYEPLQYFSEPLSSYSNEFIEILVGEKHVCVIGI